MVYIWTCCSCSWINSDLGSVCTNDSCNHNQCAGCSLYHFYTPPLERTGSQTDEKPNGKESHKHERTDNIDELAVLFDPVGHFAALEDLQARVVEKCCISRYTVSESQVDITTSLSHTNMSLEDAIDVLSNLDIGFGMLVDSGFCHSHYNILVQDSSRPEVATAIPIPRSLLVHLLNKAEVMKYASRVQELPARMDVDVVGDELISSHHELLQALQIVNKDGSPLRNDFQSGDIFKSILPILSLGLASFAGSHANAFDLSAYHQIITSFTLYGGWHFSRKPLACLNDFIGGPVWILDRPDVSPDNYMISLTVEDLSTLWGPINPVSDSTNWYIYTERGVVTAEKRNQKMHLIRQDEQLCHWQASLPDRAINDENDICTTELRGLPKILLVGKKFVNTTLALEVSASCKIDTEMIMKNKSSSLQYPRVTKPRFQLHQLGISLGVGQIVTPGGQALWKMVPGRTLKGMIMYYCNERPYIFPQLLKLRVGVEVSICTGNARRITLWEALKLYNTRDSEALCCTHEAGDLVCIRDCWCVSLNNDKSRAIDDEDYLNTIIRHSTSDLSLTGVDEDGNFQTWWPYNDVPYVFKVNPKEDNAVSGWVPVLKDTRECATFAIMSRTCLGYSGVDQEEVRDVYRKCSSPDQRRRRTRAHKQTRSNTVLETAIQLHENSHSKHMSGQPLELGSCLQIGDVGTLVVKNRDLTQLTQFERGFEAVLTRLGSGIIQAKWGKTHYELVDEDRASERTVHVVVM